MHLPSEVHAHFRRQHGIASVQQLQRAGLAPRQIEVLERNGAIVKVCRGAYRTPSAPFDELARCAAICLGRPAIVIGGPTAGRLWGFRRLPRDHRIHAISPPASNPSVESWVKPYRTAAIHDVDVVHRDDGIRLTSRARTAFDLARWLRGDDLLSVIEQAMSDGKLVETDMYAVAVEWLSPRRPWAAEYVRQLGTRLPGRPAESHAEVRVARALRRHGIHGLVRQFPIDLPDYGRARFDLAVPSARWALEVDVFPTHAETAGHRRDEARDAAASAIGWTTFRIPRHDFEQRFSATIRAAVSSYRATLAMSRSHSSVGSAHQ